jgi:hypothetical protein
MGVICGELKAMPKAMAGAHKFFFVNRSHSFGCKASRTGQQGLGQSAGFDAGC